MYMLDIMSKWFRFAFVANTGTAIQYIKYKANLLAYRFFILGM